MDKLSWALQAPLLREKSHPSKKQQKRSGLWHWYCPGLRAVKHLKGFRHVDSKTQKLSPSPMSMTVLQKCDLPEEHFMFNLIPTFQCNLSFHVGFFSPNPPAAPLRPSSLDLFPVHGVVSAQSIDDVLSFSRWEFLGGICSTEWKE